MPGDTLEERNLTPIEMQYRAELIQFADTEVENLFNSYGIDINTLMSEVGDYSDHISLGEENTESLDTNPLGTILVDWNVLSLSSSQSLMVANEETGQWETTRYIEEYAKFANYLYNEHPEHYDNIMNKLDEISERTHNKAIEEYSYDQGQFNTPQALAEHAVNSTIQWAENIPKALDNVAETATETMEEVKEQAANAWEWWEQTVDDAVNKLEGLTGLSLGDASNTPFEGLQNELHEIAQDPTTKDHNRG